MVGVSLQFDPTRSFYIVMELPKSVFRGEQIGVQVAVYNYWSQPLEVSWRKAEPYFLFHLQ